MANDIASLGIQVTTTGVAQAQTDLEKLAVSGEKAATSTEALAEASASGAKSIQAVGESSDDATSRIKEMVKASLAQVDAQTAVLNSSKATVQSQTAASVNQDKIIASQNKAMQATTALVAEQERANQAAANTAGLKQQQDQLSKLVGQIDPTVAALGRLDAQQAKLGDFKKSGALSSDDFKAYSASIDTARAKINGASDAVSHFTLNNSMARRELGILAKDLATGQYGRFEQSALTLANASGVMALAFSAAGIAVLGIVGAIALVGAAFIKGQSETDAYNKAIILTGAASGATSDSLASMAKSISSTVGTTHEAAAALAAVTASGKFTGDQLQTVATAAEEMAHTTGQSIQETIKQFSALADDPVNAIVKLNESQHFLTDAVYEQIKSLQDQGRAQDAANLAEETYANSISTRATKVKANLGTLETAWNSVKAAAAGAWDAMLDIGRAQSGDDKLLSLQDAANAAAKHLQALQSAPKVGSSGYGDAGTKAQAAEIERARQESLAATAAYHKEEHAQSDDGIAAQKAATVQQANDMAISLAQQAVQYESAEKKRADQITKAHGEANAAIAKAEAAGDEDLVAKIKASEATIVAGIESREKKPKKVKTDPEINAFKTFSGQVDSLNVKAITSDDPALTQYQQGVATLSDELNTYMSKNGDATKAAELFNQGQKALQQTLDQNYKKQNDANEQYAAALDKKNAALQLSVDNQVAQISMGSQEYQQQQQIAKVYRDQADALANLAIQRQKGVDGQSGGISKSQYDFDVNSVQTHSDQAVAILKDGYKQVADAQGDWTNGAKKAYDDIVDKAGNVAGQTDQLFTSAFDSMADSLASFATTGKLNFKGLVASILTDLAKMEVKLAASKILQSIIGAFAGGYGGTNGSGGITSDSNGFVTSVNAKGGVYDSPSLSKYSGQIVSQPTAFAFAKGAGIMGEAGPEAIMPLTRGSNGKLGVQMAGGGTAGNQFTFNISTNVDSGGNAQTSTNSNNANKLATQLAGQMKQSATDVVSRALQPGGMIWNARNGR